MVQLSSDDESGVLRVTGTDQDGRYVFMDLPAGVYGIVVGADGYARAGKTGIEVRPPFQNLVGFTLKPQKKHAAVDDRTHGAGLFSGSRPTATGAAPGLPAEVGGGAPLPVAEPPVTLPVRGRFVDRERRGIPEVSVTFIETDGKRTYQVFSGADGSFTLEALPVGLYRVLISSPGHVSLDLPSVEVEPPGGLNLSLSLVDYTLSARDRHHAIAPRERARPVPSPPEDTSP
jgi:hypothetical protein